MSPVSSLENPWSSNETSAKPEKMKNGDIESLSPYNPEVVYNYIYHINCRNPTYVYSVILCNIISSNLLIGSYHSDLGFLMATYV